MGDVCRQQGWGLVAILFCVATPGWSVPATTQPESTFTVESQAVDGVATIHCLGNPLFRLRGAGSVDRAGSVVQALRSAFFSARVLPPEVSVADERPPVVCVGEHPVVTVTREDAGANDTEPKALAEVWRENLSAAFERWSRKPLPGKLTVPLGGALGWRLASGTGDLRGVRLDPQIVSVAVVGEELRFQGTAVGTTHGALYGTNMEAPVAVSVLPAAATIAEAAGVKLSRPDSPNALRRQAMILAARSVVRLHTAAEVRAEPLWDEVGGARVRVRASSPQGLDVEQLVRIDLSHRALPVGECEELFVSNSPERLHRPQSLLGAHLTGRSRLLYHHLNESGRTLRLVVELLNRGDLDEEVGLLVSAAGPAADEMHVGHTAAREFLRARSRTEGIALTVTPGAVLRVVDVRLPVGRIVSGLLELIPLAPQTQLAVRVRAIAPTEPDSPSTSLTETPQFVFGETSLREDAAYTVGGRWAFVSLGRHAISAKTGAHELAGNYGVVHEVTLSVHNPTREAALVKLVFAPAGGVARGTFLLGGELIETPMTQSGAESLLKAVPLPPGAHRKIRLLTMPESASNYPIRLIAKAD